VTRARRLDEILDAGARLLAERGFYGFTMRDVAAAAGTAGGNLYHYVGGKDDLLCRVQMRILEAAVASAQAALAVRGAQQRLRALITDHIRRTLARPAEAIVIRGGTTPLRGEKARRVEELRRRYFDLVRLTAEAVVRRGQGTGREAEARTSMLLGMTERLALDALGRRPPPQPGRLATRVLQLYVYGARKKPAPRRTTASRRKRKS
jgi:AcrR family transcriptional regulator